MGMIILLYFISEIQIRDQNYQGRSKNQPSRNPKRETNPDVALKIRSKLNRSLSNVHRKEEEEFVYTTLSRSTENISTLHEQNNDNPYANRNDTNLRYDNEREDIQINNTNLRYDNERDDVHQINLRYDREDVQPSSNKKTPKSILKKNSPENSVTNSVQNDIDFDATNTNTKINADMSNSLDLNRNSIPSFEQGSPHENTRRVPREYWDDIVDTRRGEFGKYDENAENHYDLYNAEYPYEDRAYVIEIQEGPEENSQPLYSTVQKEKKKKKLITFEENVESPVENSQPLYTTVQKEKKKKKLITFEENVSEIEDDGLYDNVIDMEHGEHRRLSDCSNTSLSSFDGVRFEDNDKDVYGNDYSNAKRTSCFQAGGTTFSSQAASIFFGNKKPVNERRPTKFMPAQSLEDNQSSA